MYYLRYIFVERGIMLKIKRGIMFIAISTALFCLVSCSEKNNSSDDSNISDNRNTEKTIEEDSTVDKRNGYSSIKDAVAADVELINEKKWSQIIDQVNDYEWSTLYGMCKVYLEEIGCNDYTELKNIVKNEKNYQFIIDQYKNVFVEYKSERIHEVQDYDTSISVELFCNSKYYDKYWKESYKVEFNCSGDEVNPNLTAWDRLDINPYGFVEKVLYYRENDKYYSSLSVSMAICVIENIIDEGRKIDLKNARNLKRRFNNLISDESVYNEIEDYQPGTILLVAEEGGEFESMAMEVNDFNMLMEDYEFYYGEKAKTPNLNYHGNKLQWSPRRWAIVWSSSGNFDIYITDESISNMIDVETEPYNWDFIIDETWGVNADSGSGVNEEMFGCVTADEAIEMFWKCVESEDVELAKRLSFTYYVRFENSGRTCLTTPSWNEYLDLYYNHDMDECKAICNSYDDYFNSKDVIKIDPEILNWEYYIQHDWGTTCTIQGAYRYNYGDICVQIIKVNDRWFVAYGKGFPSADYNE